MGDLYVELNFVDRGVIINDHYIISDLHLGYSDTIDSLTIEDEREEILPRIKSVLEEYDVNTLVVAGDVFHSFGSPSQSAREFFRSLDSLSREFNVTKEFLRGNHDTEALEEFFVSSKFDFKYQFSYEGYTICVTHGHKIPEISHDVDLYIIGHLHPVVRINGVDWPAYLHGKNTYDQASLLVVPAFSSYKDGVVVSDHTKTNINFPFVEPEQFADMKPLVYDSNNGSVKEFPVLSKSSEFFGL